MQCIAATENQYLGWTDLAWAGPDSGEKDVVFEIH